MLVIVWGDRLILLVLLRAGRRMMMTMPVVTERLRLNACFRRRFAVDVAVSMIVIVQQRVAHRDRQVGGQRNSSNKSLDEGHNRFRVAG